MDDSDHDKSEAPTAFKLERARRKGTVARGVDLGFFAAIASFFAWAAMEGADAQHAIALSVQQVLGALADGQGAMFEAAALLLWSAARPLALMAGCVFGAVLLFEIVQTGFTFSAEPLRPDFGKLNPAKGLKRIMSFGQLMQTGKQVLKLCACTTVGFLIVRGSLEADSAWITDGGALSHALTRLFFKLLGAFVLLATVFALLDQLVVRREFMRRMRMSRRELRRELRDREGDVRLKQKRKQMHAEFLKASRSLRNIRTADVLITNPSHVAVALRYDPQTMLSPVVVSLGANKFAQRLKGLAFVYGVPIIENRNLAWELYRYSGLDNPIPEKSFESVASVYISIRKSAGRLAGAG